MKWFIYRVFRIVIFPKKEWERIEEEHISTVKILTKYLIVLVIFSGLLQFLGRLIVDEPLPGMGTFVNSAIFIAVVSAVVILGIFFNAYIINALSPFFKGEKNFNSAFKLVCFANTPVYLSSIVNIVRFMQPVRLVIAIYSIVLLYFGLPILMKCPREKAAFFTIISILILLTSYIIGSLVITIALI